jgi:iron complex outermembrane recepter protein
MGCAVWALMGGAAMAQTPAVAAASGSDDIVVTGTREEGYRATVATTANKTATPVKETPFSIQVVTRELIEDRGVTTLGEAVRTVPGLTPQVGLGGFNDRFRLRGFQAPANLKNGLRRSTYIPIDELVNIEQIEVLKGPSSALYGRFEPGGVVNMVTKKPLDEQVTRIGFTGGSYDFYRGTLDTTGPIADGLGYRLTAAYQDAGSFRDFADAEVFFVSPVLSWSPSPSTNVTFEAEYARRKGGLDRGFGNNRRFLEVPISMSYGEAYAVAVTEGTLFSLIVDQWLGKEWRLRIAGQMSDAELDGPLVTYGFPPLSGAATANPVVNRNVSDTIDRERDETLQAELYGTMLTGPIQHQLMIGAEYQRTRENAYFQFYNPGSISLFNPVYGQAPGPVLGDDIFNTEQIGEMVRILVGGRWETIDYNGEDIPFTPYAERRESAFSPRAGITFTPSETVSLYASWGKSFGVDLFSRLSSRELPEPIIGEQFEAGAKFSFAGGRITPTIALFEITRKNGPVADPNDPTFTFSIQVGEQRGRGIEVDLPIVFSNRFRLLASYTYLDAEFTEDPSLGGNRIANAPEHSGSVYATYDFSGPVQGLSIGGGVQYMGEREAVNANTFQLPAYTRLDANIAYRFGDRGRYRVQLDGFNLHDKRYYDSGGSFVPIYPGAPRTIRASLSAAF